MSLSPARSLYKSRGFLQSLKPRVDQFIKATGNNHDLPYHQFFQLAALAYEFKPDLIIELGRAYGNSTFIFTEVANNINSKVISLCNNNFWQEITLPRIKQYVNENWLEKLDARFVENFIEVDLEKEIDPAKRVLIFWDAHGFQTAEYILGYLLPMMRGKECFIILHDVTDVRYQFVDDSYKQKRIWRVETANEGEAKVRLGNFCSFNEQLISVLDFCGRNKMELRSADESYATELSETEQNELSNCLGKGFSTEAHWAYLHLDGKSNFSKLHFPAFERAMIVDENKFRQDYLKDFRRNADGFSVRSKTVRQLAIYLQKMVDWF